MPGRIDEAERVEVKTPLAFSGAHPCAALALDLAHYGPPRLGSAAVACTAMPARMALRAPPQWNVELERLRLSIEAHGSTLSWAQSVGRACQEAWRSEEGGRTVAAPVAL